MTGAHPPDVAGSLQEVAREDGWVSCEQPGQWVRISRTGRSGSTQGWWALEVVAGPYGPAQVERAVVATTDPQTLPDATTWYLVTNLPAPTERPTTEQRFAPASLEEVIRLYVSCLTLLLYVTLDGRPRHLEAFDDLGSGFPFVNGAKYLLSQIL